MTLKSILIEFRSPKFFQLLKKIYLNMLAVFFQPNASHPSAWRVGWSPTETLQPVHPSTMATSHHRMEGEYHYTNRPTRPILSRLIGTLVITTLNYQASNYQPTLAILLAIFWFLQRADAINSDNSIGRWYDRSFTFASQLRKYKLFSFFFCNIPTNDNFAPVCFKCNFTQLLR